MKIEIKDLVKSIDNKVLFEIDNLILESGKIFGFIGRNGIGKTTLFRIIAGLDEGNVLFDGNELDNKIKKNIGYVKAKPYLFNDTVLNNIKYPLNIRKTDHNPNELLDYFEISQYKDKNANLLSEGEKMKVALCRTFIYKPKVILLDEPSAPLDIESRSKLSKFIKDYVKENNALVCVISHSSDLIKDVCDRVYEFKDRQIEVK